MVKVLSRWPAREQKAKGKVKAESKLSQCLIYSRTKGKLLASYKDTMMDLR
jgi:hypothetical protein